MGPQGTVGPPGPKGEKVGYIATANVSKSRLCVSLLEVYSVYSTDSLIFCSILGF